MEFRKDINGLRAIAIIGVIIFHFNKNLLPGGFAGVDVFFVISGFLMTTIILSGLDKKNFSIWKFYYARAKRIIPALSATCFLCLLVGWTLLLPKDYFDLARNAISSMLFFSNYWYASQNGYFDASSADNALLHTWSLSAEWQFYLIYPLALALVHFFCGGNVARKSIVAGVALSLLVSSFRTPLHPTESYFTLTARAWEMLAGGLAFLTNERQLLQRKPRLWESIGLAMIMTSYFIFDEGTLWPGYNAALPVFGTVFVIAAARNNSTLTSNLAIQYVGKVSYSLYLIHWPLIVFAKKVEYDFNILIYSSIVLIISSLIYFTIERSKSLSLANIAIAIFSLIGANYVRNTHGAVKRVPYELRLTSDEFQRKYYGGYGYKTNEPYLSHSDGKVDYIIFGDSFAAQYAKAIDEKGVKSVNIFFHGCPIMPDYSRFKDGKEDTNCSKAYSYLIQTFNKYSSSDVVFASAWDNYKDFLIKRGSSRGEKLSKDELYAIWIKEIKKIISVAGKRNYYIVGRPIPTNSNSYGCLVQNVLPGYSLFSTCNPFRDRVNIEVNDRLKSAFENVPNVTFIDPNDALCSENGCVVTMGDNPAYTDGAHLSVFGAKLVFERIYDVINGNAPKSLKQ